MAFTRKNRQKTFMMEEEEDDITETKLLNRDYITLKSKNYKTKHQNESDLLEYYTTEKFNEYFKTLTPVKDTYSSQAQQEIKELQDMMQAGHNVCVFGRGSKIELLRTVQKKVLSQYHTFEIKAYLPSVTDKKISNHFGSFLIDLQITKKVDSISVRDQFAEYKKILEKYNSKIVVLLHSIDGPNLLNSQVQQKLAQLFDIPNVQLICSLDSIKMVMHWSPITLQKYKFLFFNIDTKQPYIEELKYRSLKNQNRQSTEESLLYIWQSLNKNQKQILQFIAANTLKNSGLQDEQANHFTFNQLLQLCIQEIVLSSDSQLRQNLLELLDHKVILERIDDKRNKKIYLMKYQKRTLERIMDLKVD